MRVEPTCIAGFLPFQNPPLIDGVSVSEVPALIVAWSCFLLYTVHHSQTKTVLRNSELLVLGVVIAGAGPRFRLDSGVSLFIARAASKW